MTGIPSPYVPAKAFDAISMATNQVSPAITLGRDKNMGVQWFWSGTPTGILGVQVSNDTFSDPSSQQWIPLTLTGLSPALNQPAGAAGTAWLDLDDLNCHLVQLTYTATSGSGKLSAYVMAKP